MPVGAAKLQVLAVLLERKEVGDLVIRAREPVHRCRHLVGHHLIEPTCEVFPRDGHAIAASLEPQVGTIQDAVVRQDPALIQVVAIGHLEVGEVVVDHISAEELRTRCREFVCQAHIDAVYPVDVEGGSVEQKVGWHPRKDVDPPRVDLAAENPLVFGLLLRIEPRAVLASDIEVVHHHVVLGGKGAQAIGGPQHAVLTHGIVEEVQLLLVRKLVPGGRCEHALLRLGLGKGAPCLVEGTNLREVHDLEGQCGRDDEDGRPVTARDARDAPDHDQVEEGPHKARVRPEDGEDAPHPRGVADGEELRATQPHHRLGGKQEEGDDDEHSRHARARELAPPAPLAQVHERQERERNDAGAQVGVLLPQAARAHPEVGADERGPLAVEERIEVRAVFAEARAREAHGSVEVAHDEHDEQRDRAGDGDAREASQAATREDVPEIACREQHADHGDVVQMDHAREGKEPRPEREAPELAAELIPVEVQVEGREQKRVAR